MYVDCVVCEEYLELMSLLVKELDCTGFSLALLVSLWVSVRHVAEGLGHTHKTH